MVHTDCVMEANKLTKSKRPIKVLEDLPVRAVCKGFVLENDKKEKHTVLRSNVDWKGEPNERLPTPLSRICKSMS